MGNKNIKVPEYNNSYIDQNYEIIKVLGEGGNGKVYLIKSKSKSTSTNKSKNQNKKEKEKLFAMKESKFVDQHNYNEIIIHSYIKLKCKGLLTMYDYFISNKKLYLIIDYIENSFNLFNYKYSISGDRIENYRLQLYKIFLDISKCLKCLHKLNIIHLDIKPENILITYNDINNYKSYSAYLIDYGLSCILTNINVERSENLMCKIKKTQYIGNPYIYFAPEITDGEFSIKIGNYTDIYSLGITMIEMFFNVNVHNNVYMVFLKKVENNEIYDKQLGILLLKMIDNNYMKRPNIDVIINFLEKRIK